MQEQYIPRMRSAVFTGSVALEVIEKKRAEDGLKVEAVRLPKNKGWGKQITWDIHTEPNWGMGPRAPTQGASTGYMPAAGSQGYVEGRLSAAHYYGVGELPGALIDATKGPQASTLRALDAEMRPVPTQMRRDMNIDIFGDGTGKLADVTETSSDTTFTVSDVRNFRVNQPIVIATATGTSALARTIVAIDKSTLTLTVDSSISVTAANDVFRAGIHNTNIASAYNVSMAGFLQIISSTVDYATLDRSEADYVYTRGQEYLALAKTAFTIDHMEDTLHDLKGANAVPGIIICGNDFYKNFGNLSYGNGRWQHQQVRFKPTKLSQGYPALYFHDIPLVRDHFCPTWSAYWLDLSTWALGVERDLSIMDDDGVQMVRVHGPNGESVDAYRFSFITRVNLVCSNPAANARMTINPAA